MGEIERRPTDESDVWPPVYDQGHCLAIQKLDLRDGYEDGCVALDSRYHHVIEMRVRLPVCYGCSGRLQPGERTFTGVSDLALELFQALHHLGQLLL